MLNLMTAGESHGPGITAVLHGLPAGLAVDTAAVDAELRRRQGGHGRGGRQKIECDSVEVLAGLRKGTTTGAPLALLVRNRDSRLDAIGELTAPRPGHADLAGHQATGAPIRDVLERASARETAARVAAGAVVRQMLAAFGISIGSHVRSIGALVAPDVELSSLDVLTAADTSPVRCLDDASSQRMCRAIDEARTAGESLGGTFEVGAFGVPAGLGSHAYSQARFDARLAAAFMSIPAVKGVSIGRAFEAAALPGSRVHDEIAYDVARGARSGGYVRLTNHAGGVEGGVTNGMPILVTAAMKPIPTMTTPLASVDIVTHAPVPAAHERSDVCAVPAASVVGEAMMCLVVGDALTERLGLGGMAELLKRFDDMLARMFEI